MKILQMMIELIAIRLYDWSHRKPRRTWPHRHYRTRRELEQDGQSDQPVNWEWETIQRKTRQTWPKEEIK